MDPETLLVVACALLGLVIGSFLNVVVWRVPRGESVVHPRSHCPRCDAQLAASENVPVVSWLALRGRCRHCGAPVSLRYPLVEVGCAGLWAAMALRFGAAWELPVYLGFVSALLTLALIDLDTYLLPNRIVYPLAGFLVVGFAAVAFGTGAWSAYGRALASGAAAFAAFFLVHVAAPRGMGFGDVKFAFCLGVALGWISVGTVVLGLFLGFLLGAVVGVILIALHRKGRRDQVPFGPFLAAGTVLALCFGQPLLDLYLGS
ncbi:MAG: prepilin peptidase [Actinobacteria bacterium]|nr:prepilin peptidase [Actinomycetota bacterium]